MEEENERDCITMPSDTQTPFRLTVAVVTMEEKKRKKKAEQRPFKSC